MTLDLKHLRELCDAALEGEWVVGNEGRPLFGSWSIRQNPKNWNGHGYQHIATLPASTKNTYYGDMFAANARFIAATDPPTVRALIDEIERLQQEIKIQDEGNEALISELRSVRKSEQRGVDMKWLDRILGEKL